MANEKNCVDFYGEELNIGDEVIPILSETLIMNIKGIISEIRYKDGYYFIVLTDKEGKLLYSGYNFESRHFTTKERFDEMENNIYSLTFYNNTCSKLASLPLTNTTNPNYKFPEGTTFISLNSKHMNEKDYDNISYLHCCNCFFSSKDKVKLYYDREYKEYSLQVLETGTCRDWTATNYKSFNTYTELKDYIKAIIKYFNKADLTDINNNVIYSQNPKARKFGKNLFENLKNNNI